MNSYEHDKTAQKAIFSISGSQYDANSFLYTVSGNFYSEKDKKVIFKEDRFRYGELVALSGDYFLNFQDLRDHDPEVIRNITNSSVYRVDSTFDFKWVTNQPSGTGRYVSYLYLALNNPEHFRGARKIGLSGSYEIDSLSDDSVNSYILGHHSALNHAINANGEKDQYDSYAINAFYDHCLTDMFSSSHLRVPRRYLHNGLLGDYYTARLMHDEDGVNGLFVVNAHGAVWQAFGDGYQLYPKPLDEGGKIELKNGYAVPNNPNNFINWNHCLEAIQASVKEVTEALTNRIIVPQSDYAALKIKPEVLPPGAEVYLDSALDHYSVVMRTLPPSPLTPTSFDFFVLSYPSKNKSLLIPIYLAPRLPWFIRQAGKVLLERSKRRLTKIPYYIETKYTPPSPRVSSPIGYQTYPLYIVADRPIDPDATGSKSRPVLFVRVINKVSSDLTKEQHGMDIIYVTAEYNDIDPLLYDSTNPNKPEPEVRLPGHKQGYPPPA